VAVVEHLESQVESGSDLRTRFRASVGFEKAGWRSCSRTRHNRRCTRRRAALARHAVPSLATLAQRG
jgi:hypothetical protein